MVLELTEDRKSAVEIARRSHFQNEKLYNLQTPVSHDMRVDSVDCAPSFRHWKHHYRKDADW